MGTDHSRPVTDDLELILSFCQRAVATSNIEAAAILRSLALHVAGIYRVSKTAHIGEVETGSTICEEGSRVQSWNAQLIGKGLEIL